MTKEEKDAALTKLNQEYSHLCSQLGDVEFKIDIDHNEKQRLISKMHDCRMRGNKLFAKPVEAQEPEAAPLKILKDEVVNETPVQPLV